MKICNFTTIDSEIQHLGILTSDEKQVTDLVGLDPNLFSSFLSMLSESEQSSLGLHQLIQSRLDEAGENSQKFDLDKVALKIPFVPREVWAAGVTYLRSREAREMETSLKGLYSNVYAAERPEIFFKTTGLRCVGPNENVGMRSDSKWSVPEPELSIVLGSDCKIIGYTIGNDMSARDIEGLNPLYLPQAKIFRNCCALGPVISTPEEIPNPKTLQIKMRIERTGSVVFAGSISTAQIKRSIEELVSYLKRDNIIPAGSVFMTGTGIVPPDDFSIQDKDIIEIEIERIGRLRNIVSVLS